MKLSARLEKIFTLLLTGLLLVVTLCSCSDDRGLPNGNGEGRPNFLFILSDDQSWEHTSFAGYPLVDTPNFDRVAQEGIYFINAYATAPTCTASRSSILAGQPIWRLGAAANLHGEYSPEMISYQNILANAGYAVGSVGKGWAPGYVTPGRSKPHPPTGKRFNDIKRGGNEAHGAVDLEANFIKFLDNKKRGAPFSFWVGSVEPHRPYDTQAKNRFDNDDSAKYIPGVLPDTARVRAEFSAYLDEIEVFDRDVGKLLGILDDRGILDNTVVVITSDNGMPFSRGKPTNYDYGVRVPLAIRWGSLVNPGRVVDDFVSLADMAPTFLDLARVLMPERMTGRSLGYALLSDKAGWIDPARDASYSAFERHAGYIRAGDKNLTYPRRAIHTEQFVYIRNYFPERWPAGDPPRFLEAYPFLLRAEDSGKPIEPFYSLATAKRPAEELYNIVDDPDQLENIASQPEYAEIRQALAARLHDVLVRTEDPLETSGVDVFQDYKYWYHR